MAIRVMHGSSRFPRGGAVLKAHREHIDSLFGGTSPLQLNTFHGICNKSKESIELELVRLFFLQLCRSEKAGKFLASAPYIRGCPPWVHAALQPGCIPGMARRPYIHVPAYSDTRVSLLTIFKRRTEHKPTVHLPGSTLQVPAKTRSYAHHKPEVTNHGSRK